MVRSCLQCNADETEPLLPGRIYSLHLPLSSSIAFFYTAPIYLPVGIIKISFYCNLLGIINHTDSVGKSIHNDFRCTGVTTL